MSCAANPSAAAAYLRARASPVASAASSAAACGCAQGALSALLVEIGLGLRPQIEQVGDLEVRRPPRVDRGGRLAARARRIVGRQRQHVRVADHQVSLRDPVAAGARVREQLIEPRLAAT